MVQPVFTRQYRLVNLVSNGNFEDGITGWSSTHPVEVVTDAVEGSALKIVPTGAYGWAYTDPANRICIPQGHIIYMAGMCKRHGSGNTRMGIYNTDTKDGYFSVFEIEPDVFTPLSILYTVQPSSGNTMWSVLIYGSGNATWSEGDYCIWDNVLLLDLTVIFGKGAEPTKTWCDEHISYFNGDAYLIIEDSALDTITDRTAADAAYARQVQSTTTVDLKGAYNASDFNRVERNCRYLAEYLSYRGYRCNIETKIDWTMSDIPYLYEHMNRIRGNVIKIIDCFLQFGNSANAPDIPMDKLMDYRRANDLEKNLQLTIDFLNSMMLQYPICGPHYCGELY